MTWKTLSICDASRALLKPLTRLANPYMSFSWFTQRFSLFFFFSQDNFWTTSYEAGSSTGPLGHDSAVWREAAVATLSTGPVTPADGIPYQNKNLIMRSCRNDGRLINPDRPAVTMDMAFKGAAFGSGAGPRGQLWNTYSTVAGERYEHIFAAELQDGSASVYPANLTLDRATGASGSMVAYAVGNTTSLDTGTLVAQTFTATTPIVIKTPDLFSFALWHVSPVQSNGVALLGDLSKWVPVADTRIASVAVAGSSLKVAVLGSAGEKVTIHFATGATTTSASCVVSAGTNSCTVVSP